MSTAYDWLTLDDDEEIVWSGQPSSTSLYGTYIVGVLLIPLVGLGLLVILGGYLTMTNTDYVITTKGVYKKSGILSRSVAEIEYEKVQNTAYSAGPIGRSLGYGNVEISTAGGSGVEMTLQGVEDPQAVQKQLSRKVKQVQGTREDAEGESKADVLDEILVELRAIRQSLENEPRQPTDRGFEDR